MVEKLNIVSLNTRGLNDKVKRKRTFQFLKNQDADVILIQQTFVTQKILSNVERECDGKSVHNIINSCHSRGVAILFKKSLDVKMLDVFKSDDARL